MTNEHDDAKRQVGEVGSSEELGAAAEAHDRYAPGTPCTVNTSGDMFMLADARGFFGVPCVVVKRTKAGLILVARHGDLKHTYSFPQKNVDVLETPNAELSGARSVDATSSDANARPLE